ncbi:MAG TPA: threonine/serine dehydratase [Gemmatimonadales bacterium]|nr:threonine/serine dehydratase [Gemmatimonadales bacterium]
MSIDAADLAAARDALSGVARRTPLIEVEGFDHPVRLKAEYLQPIGAFKLRGAWNAISRLDAAARSRGVVTSSSGNHGYALAWAAHRQGIRAAVVMPESAPAIKRRNIETVGGEVHLVGAVRGPEQFTHAEMLAEREGMTLIHPFDHPDVIAGQATCTLEILEDWPEVSRVVVPTGGGGLLSGACLAVRFSGRTVGITGVEPEHVPKLSRALAEGRTVDVGAGTSLADGTLTRSLGELTWPIIREAGVDAVAASDAEIRAALRWLADREIVAEPSGALPVAALLSGRLELSGPTALIVSGGNVDPARHAELVSE